MNTAFIISEYHNREANTQTVLEKVRSEESFSYYRVTTVQRYKSMDAAKEAYLKEIPRTQRESRLKDIADYIKGRRTQNAPKQPPAPTPAKGRKENAKSKQKAT